MKQLEQANQPDPEAQRMQQEMMQKEIQMKDGSIALLEGQAAESQARATKYVAEAKAVPAQTELRFQEMQFEQVRAAAENMVEGDEDDKEFDRRLKILSELRADRQLQLQEKKADTDAKNADAQVIAQTKDSAVLKEAIE